MTTSALAPRSLWMHARRALIEARRSAFSIPPERPQLRRGRHPQPIRLTRSLPASGRRRRSHRNSADILRAPRRFARRAGDRLAAAWPARGSTCDSEQQRQGSNASTRGPRPPRAVSPVWLMRSRRPPAGGGVADLLRLQRTVGNQVVQRMCAACADDGKKRGAAGARTIRAKPVPGRGRRRVAIAGGPVGAGRRAPRPRGQPAGGHCGADFEPRFGVDLGGVRHVRHDDRAAETAQSLQARAFTLGQDIAFGAGGSTRPPRPATAAACWPTRWRT